MPIKIIGLTGPSGAGKSSVCSFFSKLGIPFANADDIYHKLISSPSPCLSEIADTFGQSVISESGALDRAALASVVFAHDAQDKLTTLNSISHKYVIAEILSAANAAEAQGFSAFVADVPLLFESDFNIFCDTVISVIAEKSERLSRVVLRDCISEEAATARFSSQKDDEFYISRSDYIIYNSGTLNELENQANTVLRAVLGTEYDALPKQR